MASLKFHGHATFTLTTDDGVSIVIDPFFDENPMTELTSDDVTDVDFILCTHGHFDHFADAIPIAKRTGATLVATFEIVSYAQSQGVENAHPMHIGGSWQFPFGRVKMTNAVHGGQVAGEGAEGFSTNSAGFLIDLGPGRRIHHAGDTALTMDMQLLQGKVDVALLPIGDNFTMGPEDAVTAIDFIQPEVVVPIHYNSWPLVEQDPEAFKALVGDRARVEVLDPGDTLEL
ncbi:MAG: metal-dependent hydrolase [Gemmatimonadota bacterium]|nr:MAG: metal-dependent hydrolase [Gemmatimonadota bacterium]